MVTHLFGNPCEMSEIMTLARARGIAVIEDCAQALGTRFDGRPVGTLGAVASFSLQQGKHVTTGEGGLVATNDSALARRMVLFINKAWGYGDPQPDHYFLALHYRMTDLHGAVAVARLPSLRYGLASRRARTRSRTTARASPGPSQASSGSWYCRGPSATPMSTSTTSPTPSATQSSR